MSNSIKILGIDPGLRSTGFGVVEVINGQPQYVSSGVIQTTAKGELATRLKEIFQGVNQVVKEYQPQEVSVEKVFVNVNPQSTLLLGQARGAAICACVLHDLAVSEYTALQVKQSVVGYGHAEKSQVAKMVKYLLKLNKEPKADAADALAICLAHLHYSKMCKVFNVSSVKNGRLLR